MKSDPSSSLSHLECEHLLFVDFYDFLGKDKDPSILDVLELVEHYDFSYYATAFDVDTICDWRAPPSTLNWLEKYREKLEIQCSFDPRAAF